LALAVTAREARADIIFSNFGPGGTFNTGNGNPIGFDFFTGDNDAQADSFVPGGTFALNSLTLALASLNRTNSAPLTVSIAGSSGLLPGPALESWTIGAGVLPTFGSLFTPLSLTSILQPTLIVGLRYWVTVSGSGTDSNAWNLTLLTDANPTATSVNGGATYSRLGLTPGAVRLDGTAVPEPSEWVLTASGLAFIAGVGRRRRPRNGV